VIVPLAAAAATAVLCAGFFFGGYRRTAHVFWVVAIGLVSLPFESFQTHSHWDKIGWIPFYSWPVRPLDIVQNILLYMPLGYLAVPAARPRTHVSFSRVALEAFVLSLAMEVSQDFSHSRFPAATDLVCNVAGALLGALLGRP
jgi:glycopeptide antibiotics resistance protein